MYLKININIKYIKCFVKMILFDDIMYIYNF